MIAILGAGSMGRLWAATLPAGQVAFVPRPGQHPEPVHYRFQPIEGEPLSVTVPWLQPGQSPDLLLVTTKAGDTLEALTSALPSTPPSTPIVLFQNGLGSQQQVAETWPERPVLAASTTEGANRPQPGLTVHAGRGTTWLGALNPAGQAHVEPVAQQLATSGLAVQPEPDILGRLWQKLVINAGINPFTALLDSPNGEILGQPFYLKWIDPLCQEISQLLDAAGQPSAAPEILRETIEAVARKTAANTSSMRADMLAGRETEIDFINGYLARLGHRYNIAAPVNQMLTERVKQLN
ncbi:ketopantoate reductase family protein [Marinobacter sp. UBA3607]|jgi:2-dehydropantoate 2-reductase|uniref:ketopantoate reductase family protein n=1 Tax=Marinobacter sp. UBA3607 TaxID=1946820 RepID=UPI00257FACB7|nr:2-dehydropantoate 2-reductase [Marinobacter sp. UBA3607]|tara:strand:- start:14604 stop:15488 length:885 start_codon:yes stop_codon:yes gene_type:complete